jgi:hypothetical protein
MHFGSFLGGILANLGFLCLIILGEVSKSAISFHVKCLWYVYLFILKIMKLLA